MKMKLRETKVFNSHKLNQSLREQTVCPLKISVNDKHPGLDKRFAKLNAQKFPIFICLDLIILSTSIVTLFKESQF